MSFKMHFS